MRERLYNILDGNNRETLLAKAYDFAMIVIILASLVPLAFKQRYQVFVVIEVVVTIVFLADYLFRWMTADIKLKKGPVSFLIYPVTFMGIVDLISILPAFLVLSQGFKVVRIVRLIRALRVFAVFKLFRHSRNAEIIAEVFKRQKSALLTVAVFAAGYIAVTALVVFNAEPSTFNSFFDALYWATVTLATVGYGDVVTVSTAGHLITMISTLFGIAVIALPSGIITAGYMEVLQSKKAKEQREEISVMIEMDDVGE